MFYSCKNESLDEKPDDEILDFMRTQFEEICFGDLEYLSGTCLERFAKAVRFGSLEERKNRRRDEYVLRETDHKYRELEEETRWDFEVYAAKLGDFD